MSEKIILNAKQAEAVRLVVKEGRNVFISGAGGTGKSTIINEIKKHFKNVIVAAPTGRAALQINGRTLHSVFNLPIRPLMSYEETIVPNAIIAAEVIIIDEISMVRPDYFNGVIRCIEMAIEKCNPKRIVVIGDFFQLPPVVTPYDRKVLANAWPGEDCSGLCFTTRAWERCHFCYIELTENVRSVDKLHTENLKRMRVMSVCNSINGYKNGSTGIIERINDEGIKVAFDKGIKRLVTPCTWEEKRLCVVNNNIIEKVEGWYKQIPLIPAYAITIHKAQGATFDSVNIFTDVFLEGMLYVAFSRCRSAANIWIDKPLCEGVLLASKVVKQFYSKNGMLQK